MPIYSHSITSLERVTVAYVQFEYSKLINVYDGKSDITIDHHNINLHHKYRVTDGIYLVSYGQIDVVAALPIGLGDLMRWWD